MENQIEFKDDKKLFTEEEILIGINIYNKINDALREQHIKNGPVIVASILLAGVAFKTATLCGIKKRDLFEMLDDEIEAITFIKGISNDKGASETRNLDSK